MVPSHILFCWQRHVLQNKRIKLFFPVIYTFTFWYVLQVIYIYNTMSDIKLKTNEKHGPLKILLFSNKHYMMRFNNINNRNMHGCCIKILCSIFILKYMYIANEFIVIFIFISPIILSLFHTYYCVT